MSAVQQLKQAFIKQAHEQDKMVTLAVFAKELQDDLEVAAWIVEHYAHDYEQHTQMHMKQALEAQLKLNDSVDSIVTTLLGHLTKLATNDTTDAATKATQDLLSKFKLH
jgi:adenosyl cobinamide kinase/adenosyl cobinamide phosphate guanylyltransferase